jgi:hypothetical protein
LEPHLDSWIDGEGARAHVMLELPAHIRSCKLLLLLGGDGVLIA